MNLRDGLISKLVLTEVLDDSFPPFPSPSTVLQLILPSSVRRVDFQFFCVKQRIRDRRFETDMLATRGHQTRVAEVVDHQIGDFLQLFVRFPLDRRTETVSDRIPTRSGGIDSSQRNFQVVTGHDGPYDFLSAVFEGPFGRLLLRFVEQNQRSDRQVDSSMMLDKVEQVVRQGLPAERRNIAEKAFESRLDVWTVQRDRDEVSEA